MCELCGCTTHIDSGKHTIIKRAEAIVKQLNLTRENIQLFEDCERISREVVSYSFPSLERGEIPAICRWVHSLHEPLDRDKFPKYLDAAEDVFSRLPVKSDTKEAITVYHQLEQLLKEIGDEELLSIREEDVREALKAVRSVHDNNLLMKARLKERYGLD